ncbi:LOB domain-containing protein 20 [Juglans microcarpa x Juglans regia]|uniref:LOB domain-containing protein 20 n=1 Tax=Juglans microcarpa x Juglans regia TaxID=2249226 RepID=UPI001B7DF4DE|nr:LOB domain-containing protein 20 [Juglans microcarpa x Juglans regia]
MAEPQGDDSTTSGTRRKGMGKRALAPAEVEPAVSAAAAPCGACKFLRRKCVSGCIFAPHFGSDQGAARFAAVHKVFGASNVSKLLVHVPVNRRHDAVVTISYEAQARLSDPVFGCVSTILALQQQVASLQAELAMVQTQLINSRFAFANAIQNSHQHAHEEQHQQQQQHEQRDFQTVLQPDYSNNSSASTNLVNNINGFTTTEFDLAGDTTAPISSQSLDPLVPRPLSRPSQDEEEYEEESRIPPVFVNKTLHLS